MSAELAGRIAAGGRIATHEHGECIHHRGDPISFASFVLAGSVRLSTVSADGRRLISANLGAGECFAVYQLFTGGSRTHDAHAEGDVRLANLGLPAIRRLIATDPELSEFLLLYHARRLVRTMETLEDDRRLPVRTRVAKRILHGCNPGDCELIRTQAELADELGVSRYAVGTALAELSRKGFVEVAFRKVRLRDRPGLSTWIEHEGA